MARVLIVDDAAAITEALVDVLSDAAHEVRAARTWVEFVQMLGGGWKPDIIFLDLMMPEVDGWFLLQRLKVGMNLRYRHIPVVVITASRPCREAALTAGASAYLQKPIDLDDLLRCIERHVPG